MGYHMVVVKDPSCDTAQVTSIVTSLVRGGKNVTNVGTELSYVLPSNSSQKFPELFDTLDGQFYRRFRILHMTLSMATSANALLSNVVLSLA